MMKWVDYQCRQAMPIVFVVDDDVSVRESLELLVRNENWKPETFASAQEFLNRPRTLVPELSRPGPFTPRPERS